MANIPLATLLRPDSLEDFVGQKHLVGESGPIKQMLSNGRISSMIFWGPPASGKTTLSKIIASSIEAEFYELSAVMDGKEELKKVILNAKQNQSYGKNTVLFVDEIHRWNKAQQDALLPFVESGQITLIGATTENPSFEIISPLLSRARVFVFESHSFDDILELLKKGLWYLKNAKLKIENEKLETDDFVRIELQALETLANLSNGDPRFALNSLEIAYENVKSKIEDAKLNENESDLKKVKLAKKVKKSTVKEGELDSVISGVLTSELVSQAIQKYIRYDKNGEEHYNIISAVHKSLRSSNASAAIYWIMRMLQAGEDPVYIARRLLRFASEDVGNAAPNALVLANAVFDTCLKIGMPECEVALVQLAEYLARSPKSNKAYTASKLAKKDVMDYGNLPVPMHFRNAPTKLMKDLGYGKNYEYDHDLENKKSDQECFPFELKNRNYFN